MSSIDYHEILRQADVAFPSSLDEAAAAAAVAGAVANAEEEGEGVGVDVGAEGMDVDVGVGAGLGVEGGAEDGQHHGGEYQHEHDHQHHHEHEHLDPADGEFLLPEEQHNLHHAHAHAHGQLSDLPIASGGDIIDPQPSHGESSRAGAEGAEGGRVSRGALSVQEKRERQKAQNRKAAERSRQKKRTEQMALEANVQQMQNENQRLRARLAALVANRPSKSPALPENETTPVPSEPAPSSLPNLPAASPPAVAGTGIDYTYVTKLLNELSASKSILLDKTLELSRLLDGAPPQEASGGDRDNSDERSVLRRELLAQWCRMVGIKVEGRGLEAMLRHLRGENESLGTQRQRVLRELEGRRAVRDAVAVVQGGEVGEAQEEVPEAPEATEEREGSGVEVQEEQEVQHEQGQEEARQEDGEVHVGDSGSMEDIRGWIDAAVNIWDQEGKTSNNEGII
ncbi:hypothetical protein IAT38_002434 [Cryptococcus sp. DSM 104549]